MRSFGLLVPTWAASDDQISSSSQKAHSVWKELGCRVKMSTGIANFTCLGILPCAAPVLLFKLESSQHTVKAGLKLPSCIQLVKACKMLAVAGVSFT